MTAVPGKKHLWELKKAIYDTPYENDEALPSAENLTLERTVKVCAEIKLDNNEKMVNRKNLNYSVFKNDVKIKEGKLSNLKNNVLVTTSIGLKAVDNYEILIWGDSNASGYYNYEVVIKK